MAARVADNASSTLALRSFSSGSVGAPTLTTATPPDSLAKRSCSFSLSYSDVVSSICTLICSVRPLMLSEVPCPSMMVVRSLVDSIRRAWPRSAMVAWSRRRPVSSEITCPPVSTAMSSNMALRRSPKPGAFRARQFSVPRRRLTTNTAKASLSMSSPMMTKLLLTWSTCSSKGTNSVAAEIFLSVIRMYGFSITASIRSGLVTK